MKYLQSFKLQIVLLILIMIINLSALFYVAPLSQNLSDLGNALGHRSHLILWGCSAAIYFYYYTRLLMKKTHYTNAYGLWLLRLSCIMMIISVLLPYNPQDIPDLAKWHTRIAMWGTIGYVLCFFHYTCSLYANNPLLFQKIGYSFLMLVIFDCLLFLLNGGVSTLLEISFTIFMSSLLLFYRNI